MTGDRAFGRACAILARHVGAAGLDAVATRDGRVPEGHFARLAALDEMMAAELPMPAIIAAIGGCPLDIYAGLYRSLVVLPPRIAIMKAVAEAHGVTVPELFSRGRSGRLTNARRLLFLRLRDEQMMRLNDIAHLAGRSWRHVQDHIDPDPRGAPGEKGRAA